MDNLAHTLVGASLAEAGLKRLTPLATTTLIVAANLPDVDGACYLVGSDVALWFRRGWTHGILALALWPLVLSALLLVLDRARRHPDRPPADPRALLALSVLGVLSHPALDWLNTYGVRLLMPFDGRWFYGDALFIVDPWLWLLAGSAALAGRARTRLAIAGWCDESAAFACQQIAHYLFLVLLLLFVQSGAHTAHRFYRHRRRTGHRRRLRQPDDRQQLFERFDPDD